jgi:hypothetical protein
MPVWRLLFALSFAGASVDLAAAASVDGFTCRALAAHRNEAMTVEVTLAGVPAILRVPASITRPPIVLWHGFGPPASAKALMDALPLDDVAAIKVYLGLPLFGARAPEGGTRELGRRQAEDFASLLFEPAVMGAARELPGVIDAMRAIGCIKSADPIGLFGFSGGGAAVLFALAERKVRIGSAVVLNASTGLNASVDALERATAKPYAWTDAARKLARQSDAVVRARDIAAGNPPPAVLIIQGAADTTMTPRFAITLHDALEPVYRNSSESRLRLRLVDGMTHAWSDARSMAIVRTSVAAWFDRHLQATRSH